jgi:hypothetical protein
MTVGLMATLASPGATAIFKTEKDVSLSNTEFFPNPTSGTITIDIKNNMGTRVSISDISGRILMEIYLNQPVNTINLNHLPDGIYLFSLTGKSELITRKIIKSH